MVKNADQNVIGLEEPLRNADYVSRKDLRRLVRIYALLASGAATSNIDLLLIGAERVAAGQCDGIQDTHAVHIRIFAGFVDFADNIEGPVIDDLNADARVL